MESCIDDLGLGTDRIRSNKSIIRQWPPGLTDRITDQITARRAKERKILFSQSKNPLCFGHGIILIGNCETVIYLKKILAEGSNPPDLHIQFPCLPHLTRSPALYVNRLHPEITQLFDPSTLRIAYRVSANRHRC